MKSPHHIIAIGASAGGLSEINSFFDHTPLDQVSYIIIQHLSPDFKSHMVDLLAKHSKLKVKEAEDGMRVLSNEVYLIPNDKVMTVEKGLLYLSQKLKGNRSNLTINTFFKSLALDAGPRAIGIILSGLGSDGTEGIKAIKKAGGMVMVRPSETTEYGSMPFHAISTGLVDFILEPEAMPEAIEEFIQYGKESILEMGFDDLNLNLIIQYIKAQNSLDFSEYKPSTLLRRAKRRAYQLDYNTLSAYLPYFKSDPLEIESLSKEFLISVTSFFRDKEAFQFLAEHLIPSLIKNLNEEEELKIWVAGCATGEEVYSLAILIAEEQSRTESTHNVKIFATDIDELALNFAGKGLYTSASLKPVEKKYIDRYFNLEGNHYRIQGQIRKMVIFARHDLVKNPPYCNMHFISCRNLLIYMTPVLQKRIFEMILFGLKQGGFLFLGSSENPISIIQNLEVIENKWKIYKKLGLDTSPRFDSFLLPETINIKPFNKVNLIQEKSTHSRFLTESIIKAIIPDSGILVICELENKNVVRSYGDTSRILLQKNFNLHLPELLPGPLADAFNYLCSEIDKESKPVFLNHIRIHDKPHSLIVNIKITPIEQEIGETGFLMVLIKEEIESHGLEDNPVFNLKEINREYCLNLEDEIKRLKEELFLTRDQLDASYENLQSFNEELLSTNEEMQSSNEEMQSVNEELDTINNSFQIKNRELTELNDDLNNYFRSNVNGQLFVDKDLKIIRFSPICTELINLLESDIGRSISDISTNFKVETLADDLRSVLIQGTPTLREIQTFDRRWFQINSMPYIHQSDNKRKGAIVTFTEVTELKRIQLELNKKNQSLLRINADLDNFVLAASHDLLAPLGNIELSINVMNMIEVKDPELSHFLEIINASVVKFRNLIKDMAVIAKLESEVKIMEWVDIEEIINNIEWSLSNKIKESGTKIKRNLQVERIMYSKKNLRSVLFNLISNAIKFKGDRNPVIYILTKKEGDFIQFIVEDNGIGISKVGMERIFDIYGRLKQDEEGLGIGLYLAQKIIHASGGDIQVESELDKGTKFTVFLREIPELV